MGDTSYTLVSMIGIEDIGSPEVWFWFWFRKCLWGLEGSAGPAEWVRVEPEK